MGETRSRMRTGALVLAVAMAALLLPVTRSKAAAEGVECHVLGVDEQAAAEFVSGMAKADVTQLVNYLNGVVTTANARLRSLADDQIAIPLVGNNVAAAVSDGLGRLDAFRTDASKILRLLGDGHAASVEAARAALYLTFGPGAGGRAGLGELDPEVSGRLDAIMGAVGTAAAGILKDGPDEGSDVGPSDVVFESCSAQGGAQRWVKVDVHLGQSYVKDTAPFGFNVDAGTPALGFAMQAPKGVRFNLRWDLRLGFGFTNLDSQKRNNFFVDAGKTLSGDREGSEVPEFRAEAIVIPVPQSGTTAPLSARAGLGLLNAQITDGTPFPVSVVASKDSVLRGCGGGLCGPANPNGFSVTGTYADGRTKTWRIAHSAKSSPPMKLMLDLNQAMSNASPTAPRGCELMKAMLAGLGHHGENVAAVLMQRCAQTPVPEGSECSWYPQWLGEALGRNPSGALLVEQARVLCNVAATERPDPFPALAATLNFSKVSGFDSGGITLPRLEIVARDEGIRRLKVDGGTEYGFLEGEQDELEALALGFAPNQASIGNTTRQTLTASAPLPDGGTVAENEVFYIRVRQNATSPQTSILVTLNEERLRDVASTEQLFDAVRDVVIAELNAKSPFPGQFDVEKVEDDAHITVRLVSKAVPGKTAPLISIGTPSGDDKDHTMVTLHADVDVVPNNGYQAHAYDEGDFRTYPLFLRSRGTLPDSITPSISAEAALRFHVDGKAGPAESFGQALFGSSRKLSLPAIEFDLRADPSFTYTPGGGLETSFDEIVLDHVKLDVGDISNNVLRPIGDFIGRTLGPALGVLGGGPKAAESLLNQRLPGISELLDKDVSIMSMLRDARVAGPIEEFQAIANQIATLPQTLQRLASYRVFDFGCIAIDTRRKTESGAPNPMFGVPLPCELARAVTDLKSVELANFLRTKNLVDSAPSGFQFDILQFQNVIKLGTGKAADIVTFRLPKIDVDPSLKFRFGWEQLGFDVDAAANVTAGAGVTYDTTGLAEVAAALDRGAVPSPESLARGFYITAPSGRPVSVSASFGGGASIDVFLFAAWAEIDIGATLDLRLADPNGDGKLRYDEIKSITNGFSSANKLYCLFDVTGSFRFDVSGGAKVVGIDVGSGKMGLNVPHLSLQELLSSAFGSC